jgi:GrpB protein
VHPPQPVGQLPVGHRRCGPRSGAGHDDDVLPRGLLDEEAIARARVKPHVPAPVEVVVPDPGWPAASDQVRERITNALGSVAVEIEHVGSTSVPGLWAKPVIDVDLVVPDSSDERAFLPAPTRAGGGRVRAPGLRAGVGAAPLPDRSAYGALKRCIRVR